MKLLFILAALVLAPLAALYARRTLPEAPNLGKLCCNFFQTLENRHAMVSKAWN